MERKLFIIATFVAIICFSSCKKEFSCEGCRDNNKPPTAVAGPDQIINLPTDSILLDGSASSDQDGTISVWLWKKISGPASFTIINTASAKTVVKNILEGIYKFELKVTDDKNLSATDTVQVTVVDPVQANRPPISNAGPDQAITLPTNTVTLNGNASSDPDNNITAYVWTKISGPLTFNIVNTYAVQTQVTNLVEGVYKFELKVTDAGQLFSKDTIQIVVNALSLNCDISLRPVINAQLVPIGTLSQDRYLLVTAAAGSKILFAGGSIPLAYSTRVDIYDFMTNTWTTAELSEGRQGMTATSVGNKIFFAGGGDNDIGAVTSRVDIYDVSLDTWSIAELSEARVELASGVLGNKVYFAGGVDGFGIRSDRVDIYDNSSNTWTINALSKGRNQLSVSTADNKIYFAGGFADNPWGVSNRIDIYNSVTNSWSTSSLFEGKMAFASIAVANKIYWASGINSLSSSGYAESNQVEIRDIATGVSSFDCMIPKSQFSAVQKGDNIIFFTGYPGETNSFDIYNLITGTWSKGLLNQSINGAAVISVNNIVYVAGGTNNGNGYYNQVWKLEF